MVGNPEAKGVLGKSRDKSEDKIKMNKMDECAVDSSGSGL
jgi:hypothetical protein